MGICSTGEPFSFRVTVIYIYLQKLKQELRPLKEMIPLSPSKCSFFHLELQTETTPKTKNVFLKWCIYEMLTVQESVCTQEGRKRMTG